MSQQKEKFVIIDGNALLHRAWHALPQTLKAPTGITTNAAYGFTTILLKAISDIHPSAIAVAFDAKGETFRDTLYAQYKAHRPEKPQELYDQIPIIQEILDAFNIHYFQKKGVEADDVIGTLVQELRSKNQELEIIIVTGDLDALQLVDKDTYVYSLKKGITETFIYDEEEVKKRYGGLTPKQLVDFKALRGDTSDNIPGAEGIGEKTAIAILTAFPSVELLYRELERASVEKIAEKSGLRSAVLQKLLVSKESVFLSRELARIKQDVAIPTALENFEFRNFKRELVSAVLQKYGFKSVLSALERIASSYGVVAERTSLQGTARYRHLSTDEEVRAWLTEASRQKALALDTETSSLDIIRARVLGISLSWEKGRAVYIESRNLALCKPLLENMEIKKIGHNCKFDIAVLKNAGVEAQGIYFDTMIAAYVLNPGERNYSLPALAFEHFGASLQKIEELIGPRGREGQLSMADVPIDKVAPYAGQDADYTWRLYEKLSGEIEKKGLHSVFYEIEMPLIPVLVEMERTGILVDTEHLAALRKKVETLIKKTEQKIYSLTGVTFNIASPKQLKDVLFDKMKIQTKGLKKTKTGVSTAASELEKLRGAHPVVEHIFAHRELAKLQSTYIDALPLLINKSTGRIHTSFNQVIAATGRLSSSEPNMQNIPIRTELGRELRRAFIAGEGFRLLSLDYSQIELRVAAQFSEDEAMIQAFEEDRDIHTWTAAKVFGKDEDAVTSEERRRAKEANFGVLYGLGPRGLSERLDIAYQEAEDFIERYRALYPRVFLFLQAVIETTRKRGYAETLYGRRRYLPDINSGSPVLKTAAERAALNMPFQGTAADIMKLAMIRVSSKLKVQSEKLAARLLLQVHDELVFEVREDAVPRWARIIGQEMENAAHLRVPLKVDAKAGKDWGDMKDV